MNRRIKNIIVIAGFIFISITVLGMLGLTSYIKKSKTPEKEEPVADVGTNVLDINIEEKEDLKITISAAGDCTFATDVNYAGGPSFVAKYNQVNNPAYFLSGVQSLFANDDLTIVNFEGTLTNLTTRQDKEFAFRGDPEYVQILTSGSVEAVNLANNHSRDYGMQSLADTRTYLSEAGVTHFGYEQTAIYEVKGVKIGLIGIYELYDHLERTEQLKQHINTVKSQGAQLIIVIFHWGNGFF